MPLYYYTLLLPLPGSADWLGATFNPADRRRGCRPGWAKERCPHRGLAPLPASWRAVERHPQRVPAQPTADEGPAVRPVAVVHQGYRRIRTRGGVATVRLAGPAFPDPSTHLSAHPSAHPSAADVGETRGEAVAAAQGTVAVGVASDYGE